MQLFFFVMDWILIFLAILSYGFLKLSVKIYWIEKQPLSVTFVLSPYVGFLGREGMWRAHSESREQDSAIFFGVWLLVIDIAALVWENLPQQELSGRLKQNFNKIFCLAIISTDLHRNTRNNDRILSHKTQNTAKRKIAYKKQRDRKQTKGISWDYGHCKQLPLAKQKQTKNWGIRFNNIFQLQQ